MTALVAALALACVALAVALVRARRDAAFHRRVADTGAEMYGFMCEELNAARAKIPAPRVTEPAPACEFCALAAVGVAVALHSRTPVVGLRRPYDERDAPRAFVVRWGLA